MPDNLGTGGSALNAQNGSSSGSDTNDALYLAAESSPYVYLPGANGNYLSVPDSAALDITGDLDLRVWCALDDWTPAAIQILIGKREVNQIAYQMAIDTTGNVRLLWSTNGSTGILATSTAATGVADGTAKWVRATLDVDNGASGYSVQFFTSDNGTSWTQLGTTVTVAGVTSVFASTANLNVGARNSGGAEPAAGKFYRAQVLNGIGGTVVCDVNPAVLTSGSATTFTDQSSNAATVTINRATSGRKSVAVVSGSVWLFGTDDYMQVADNNLLDFGASDSFSVVAVVRQWNTPTDLGIIVSKSDGYDNGYAMLNSGTTANWRALIDLSGTEVTRNSAYTAGSPHVRTMVVDRTAQTLVAWTNSTATASTSSSTVGSLANALPLRIGRSGGTTTGYQDFEVMAVAVFRRTLTTAEITAISSYYQARYP